MDIITASIQESETSKFKGVVVLFENVDSLTSSIQGNVFSFVSGSENGVPGDASTDEFVNIFFNPPQGIP